MGGAASDTAQRPLDQCDCFDRLRPPGTEDPLVGYVNTDDLQQLHRDELDVLLGSLTPATLLAVNDALRIVLALP